MAIHHLSANYLKRNNILLYLHWDCTFKEFNPRNEPFEPSAPTLGTHPQHLKHLPLDPQYYPQYVVIWYLWTFECQIINLE